MRCKTSGESLVDQVSLLIGAGHLEHEVALYPLDKLAVYAESVSRLRARERHETVIDLLAAIGGAFSGKKKEGLESFLAALRNLSGE